MQLPLQDYPKTEKFIVLNTARMIKKKTTDIGLKVKCGHFNHRSKSLLKEIKDIEDLLSILRYNKEKKIIAPSKEKLQKFTIQTHMLKFDEAVTFLLQLIELEVDLYDERIKTF